MRALGFAVVAAAALVSGCAEKATEPTVEGAVVRLSANPKSPSVGYFTVKGGPKDDTLLNVTSPVVIRIELHESMTSGGMASMKPLDGGVPIPATGTVKFEEGGKHIMLFNINPGIKAGQTLRLDFVFASGLQLSAYAPVRAAGSAT